jgi:cation:H+ antiporter
MLIALAWCVVSLAVLVGGAEMIVRGGGKLAGRLGISPAIIGLTIVAIGTSTPELAVGIDAVLKGNGSLAVGNIAGTNIVNILLILGLSALIRPLALRGQTLRLDLPMMVISAFALVIAAWDGTLSRTEGIVLMAGALIYTVIIVRLARHESAAMKRRYRKELDIFYENHAAHGIFRNFMVLVAGIAIVVLGADRLVDAAVTLARLAHVSDAFIGLTIVAIGTSAPELVTTIVSTIKGERDIAIGNLLGSGIYNILAILGVTCLFSSAGVDVGPNLRQFDIPLMAAVTLICVPVFMSGRAISRQEGALFVAAYGAYLAYLIFTRT